MFVAATAWAGFPACVTKEKVGGYAEPATMGALIECQDKAREYYRAKGGSKWDRFDDFQRSEVRRYLVRHPDRADAGPGPAAAPVEDKAFRAAREAAEQKERALKAGEANASRSDPERGAAYGTLEKKLWEMSNDGKAGVTPAMASEIVKHLQGQQGGVSVEMQSFLQSLQKDGPKLSDDSALKLKDAARDAKVQGLDLGVGADIEKWLLDRETDPKAGDSPPSYD